MSTKDENGKGQKLGLCLHCVGICVLRYHPRLSCRQYGARRIPAPSAPVVRPENAVEPSEGL